MIRAANMKGLHFGVLVAGLLAGCASQPVVLPTPPAPPAVVLCAPESEMTAPEAQPERPTGIYSQRQVALFVEQLHRWGSRGWKKLAAVRAEGIDCVDRAAVRAGGKAR